MRVALLASALLSSLFVGCAGAPEAGVPEGAEVRLALGQTVFLEGTGLSITFVDVLEDSRCPQGMECFWEGRILALLRIGEEDIVLALQPSKLPVKVPLSLPSSEERCLVVTGVFPPRLSLEPPEKTEYALLFRIEALGCGGEEEQV